MAKVMFTGHVYPQFFYGVGWAMW